jgi:hypothetical protein
MIGDKRLTLSKWMQLRWGTYRRLYLNVFRSDYVRTSLAQRLGECRRCGACCQLLRRCVLLKNDNGLPACHLYLYRTPNCSKFPIDSRDLGDRDIVSPDAPCGFSWALAQKGEQLPRA